MAWAKRKVHTTAGKDFIRWYKAVRIRTPGRYRLRQGGDDAGLGLEALADQGFDLGPEMGIAHALHVVGSQGAVHPGHAFALDGVFLVIEEIISQDLRLGIGGGDLGAAVKDAVRLVEVHGGGHV